MKQIFIKRISALIVVSSIVISFTACSNSSKPAENVTGNAKGGQVFNTPTEVSMAISSSASWPYKSDWKIWEYFEKETGAHLKVNAVPETDFPTKINLMMASPDTLPDMIYTDYKSTVDMHAPSGAFISLSDNYDKLPNMKKFFDTFTREDRNEILRQRLSGDGKIYSAPVYGTHTITNLRSWMYREDIFKKHGLLAPNTMEEVYETAKKLKKLYPNSYPICMRDAIGQLTPIASQWKKNLNLFLYYDFDNKKWDYGVRQPEIKQMVEYFTKLHREKLVPPDYATINTKPWEELVSTDRGFMMLEYLVRLDFFNIPNRKNNPDYTWSIMEPPLPNVPTGQRKLARTNVSYMGYVICNTGKQDRIDNAFKLLDWMYSDNGSDVLSWGKEGETYRVVNGKREFVLDKNDSGAMDKYGVATPGTYQRIAVEAFEASYSKEQIEQGHKAVQWNDTNANPTGWLSFAPEDESKVKDLFTQCNEYIRERVTRFMMELDPISEWDSFQKSLKDMGVDELLSYYTQAYNKATQGELGW